MTEEQRVKIIQEEWRNKQGFSHPLQQEEHIDPKKELTMPKEMFQKITLRTNDLPLRDVLKLIAEELGYQLVLGPGVDNKKVSVDFVDMNIGKILNSILYPLGYGFKIQEEDLVILAVETKVYRIVLPPLLQGFKDLTSNESGVESNDSSDKTKSGQQIKLGTKIVVSNESSDISFWGDVIENIKSLISDQGKFSINKIAGVVVVTDTPLSLNRISQYFEDLNLKVTQQIEVDVKVVEVALNRENRFGIDWNALADDLKTLNSLGLASNFIADNFSNGSFLRIAADGSKSGSGFTESGVRVAINALAKQGNVDIVSQPKVRILNNQVAVIQVGSTQSFVDHTSFETTQTGTITSISTSQVQEGVTMRLLGNIVGDEIYLSVAPVVTTIDHIRSINSGNTKIEAPQTTTKSINTLVKLKEGETVAIGGLITSYHQKDKQSVPIISKIPVLGQLFQYELNKSNKSELIIFITPRRG